VGPRKGLWLDDWVTYLRVKAGEASEGVMGGCLGDLAQSEGG
jgi:hypothetical protein